MTVAAQGEPEGASGRRYAIVVGVSAYREPFTDLPGALTDAARVAGVLTSMGYERALANVSANPTSAELRQELSAWSRRVRLGPDDVVVAYFTGHGCLHQGRFYLLGADDGEDFGYTAVPGTDLVGMVANSLAGHALVIIDACYAGTAARDAVRSIAELSGTRTSGGADTWVLASADGTQLAHSGAFVEAFETVVAKVVSKRQPYLTLEQVTEGINHSFEVRGVRQHAVMAGVASGGPPPFFPNPAYVPDLPRDSLNVRSVVRLRREQQDHFMSRSRGVAHSSEPGDFFTGRVQALSAVADWLGSPRDESGLLAVTGRAGSGKSALLGRVLALMDLDSTARLSVPFSAMPPAGLSAIAMSCMNSTVEDVVGQIAAALDAPSRALPDLLAAIAGRADPVVILLDGLDEARESGGIITEVVRPLSTVPAVRLIVSTRRSLLASLGANARIIDLDTQEFSGDTDLQAYARRLLETPGNEPEGDLTGLFRAHPDRAVAAATDIARHAQGSFGMAQLLARALRHGNVPDDDLSVLSSQSFEEFFTRYLAAFGKNRKRVADLLLPLAFAQGSGLPFELWAPLAEAVSGTPYTDADVTWFLSQHGADAFVTASATDDGEVYRLVHEYLEEYLRAPGLDRGRQGALAEALVQQVPVSGDGERDWAAGNSYIRDHLATHAAAGGVLGALLQDDGYVRCAESKALVRALLESNPTSEQQPPAEPEPMGGAERARPAEQLASRILSDRVTVLVVATEWSSAHGGLSTFNRHLCVALATAGAVVYCAVVNADPSEVADAATKGVTLLCHPGAPGAPDYGKLTRRPRLEPLGTEPDLIIGHARVTGPAAAHVQEDFFPRARRLHVVHMAPDEIEWHKLDDSTTKAQRAEERTETERRLGASAHRLLAVGPKLWERYLNELSDVDVPEPLRIDPGFDLPEPGIPAPRKPPRGAPFKVLMTGRIEDAELKGVDLGARACGLVHDLRTKASTEPIELLVRGAPPGMADFEQERIRGWSQAPGLDVVVRSYSRDPRLLDSDMAKASLVIMPSRREGFGLVGLEAVIRGVPLLLSANSGLALLLREVLGGEADPLIVPVTRNDELDASTWATRIEQCLVDREAAFARMADIRSSLADRVTWSAAAALVLAEAPPRPER